MFRIRRIYDDILAIDRDEIVQVQEILRSHFSALSERDIVRLPHQLKNPLKYRFRTILFVADDLRGRIKGFAILNHAPDIKFCYLDFISAAPQRTGGGIGGSLYERVREEALSLDILGLFFECLPDEPTLCKDSQILKQNKARLRFYERYGAYPIVNTAYETPLKPEDECPPYLVYDPLGKDSPLSVDTARAIVHAILERKYGKSCPPGYINMVIESFKDDPVRLRKPVYVKKEVSFKVHNICSIEKRIILVVNNKHAIHHVHDRGYVESPVRISHILKGIEDTGLFDKIDTHHFSEKYIKEVHENHFVEYLKKVCTHLEPGKSVYPYVFPLRNSTRPPKELPIRAGYYCIDTFTPLNENAYVAAKGAVDCSLTAARALLQGYRLSYALVRPPGHHAERSAFGGFCYFSSAAIAANYLSVHGKTAVLDIDYHHGNGTQDIFYSRSDALTISIHGHPRFAYPYFSGFHEERGAGAGQGYNINFPLQEHVDGLMYRKTLKQAVAKIIKFKPHFLVVSLGLDTAKGDPTGTWELQTKDFESNGYIIGSLRIPIVIVQEGGYKIRSLGNNARHFFQGLWKGAHSREN